MQSIVSYFREGRRLPRWGIFTIDIFIALCSVFLAFFLRFNFHVEDKHLANMAYAIPFVILVRILSFVIFKTYAGIIQYTSTEDGVRIFYTVTFGTLAMALSNIVSLYITTKYIVRFSVIIIDYFFMMDLSALDAVFRMLLISCNLSSDRFLILDLFGKIDAFGHDIADVPVFEVVDIG